MKLNAITTIKNTINTYFQEKFGLIYYLVFLKNIDSVR